MPIYKRCSRCGRRIPEGQGCPCRTMRHREYDRFSRDRKSKQFYASKEWLDAKGAVLARDGVDVYMFMTSGKIIAPDTVHHIIPLRDDWSKRISNDNLISLSSETHSRIEQEYRKDKPSIIKKLSRMLQEFSKTVDRGDV